MSTAPHDFKFNWVKARSDCSLVHVFKQLKLDVEEDCKTFNAIYQLNLSSSFRVISSDSGDIFGVCSGEHGRREVRFFLEKHRIAVRNERTQKEFAITLTLNDEGLCKLKIGEEEPELEQWQVRRRALEALLFDFV
jgi:hypothetical protein